MRRTTSALAAVGLTLALAGCWVPGGGDPDPDPEPGTFAIALVGAPVAERCFEAPPGSGDFTCGTLQEVSVTYSGPDVTASINGLQLTVEDKSPDVGDDGFFDGDLTGNVCGSSDLTLTDGDSCHTIMWLDYPYAGGAIPATFTGTIHASFDPFGADVSADQTFTLDTEDPWF